jgi:Imm-5 like putative immunity protein
LHALLGGVPGRACAVLGCWADAAAGVPTLILPKVRDPRFVTIRRGGTLTDSDHKLLALWAASCAEHVLDFFELAQPEDARPRQAIEQARAWVRGEVKMTQARTAVGHAMAAARDLHGAARHAAYAAAGPGPSRTSPHTNSARPPTRSRPHALARQKARARARATGVPVAASPAPRGDSRART